MIKVEFSAKALHFTIAAIQLQLEQNKTQSSASTSEDEIADLANDSALLQSTLKELQRKLSDWKNSPPPIGDARARGKLKLIMQCLLTEGFSEVEQNALITMGSAVSPDPSWTDYLYWPVRFGLDGSIESALDKIFTYKAIRL